MITIEILIRDFNNWGLEQMRLGLRCKINKGCVPVFIDSECRKCYINKNKGEKKMAEHVEAIRKTIRFEGGYVNDPDDKGGATKYGISSRSYPDVDIENLTMEDAFSIYKKDYWDELLLDECDSQVIGNEVFDTAVNMGIRRAALFLQEGLNLCAHSELVVDGLIGPKTLDKLNNYLYWHGDIHKINESILLKTLDGLQFEHYHKIVKADTSQRRWFRGWVRQRLGNEGVA